MTDVAMDGRARLDSVSSDAGDDMAREAWLKSVEAGEPLSGKALGDLLGKGESWGRGKIRDFRAELAEAVAAFGEVAALRRRAEDAVRRADEALESRTVAQRNAEAATMRESQAVAERDQALARVRAATDTQAGITAQARSAAAELEERGAELAAASARRDELENLVGQLRGEVSQLAAGREVDQAAHREELAATRADHARVVDGMKAKAAKVALDSATARSRRKRAVPLVMLPCAAAMIVSGWGMWTFFDDLGKLPWPMITAMFLLFDAAAVACAWLGRINRLQYGRMGVEGALVWVLAVVSGVMSASDASGREAWVRFLAPLVAAMMFEFLIRGERRDIAPREGAVAVVRRRVLARFGLLDDVDQDDEQAARARTAARLATLAYRVHQTKPGTRAHRHAVARYHRRLRVANERMGFATNVEMVRDVRINLNSLFRSVSGTSADAVTDVDVWRTPALAAGTGTTGGE